jgi:DNA-binding CsgD family transcriptional regulator
VDAGQQLLLAALDAVDGPAFVVDASGMPRLRNEAGAVLEGRLGDALARGLVEAMPAGSNTFEVSRLAQDPEPLYLAVARGFDDDPAVRVARVRSAWHLSERRAQVLILVAEGESNKEISDKLGISPNTVEIHVSAILRQTGCESRARLTARFWATAPGRRWVDAAPGR